jgi:hypothetical protein
MFNVHFPGRLTYMSAEILFTQLCHADIRLWTLNFYFLIQICSMNKYCSNEKTSLDFDGCILCKHPFFQFATVSWKIWDSHSGTFEDIMPCSLLRVSWRFGGTYGLYLQGRRISRARNQGESRWPACPPTHSLGFDLEGGSSMFLWHVGEFLSGYTVLQPWRQYSS